MEPLIASASSATALFCTLIQLAPFAPTTAQCRRACPMKHPFKSDFHTVVTEAGVKVTFKPTNSVYSFHRLADSHDVARLGPLSFAGVQHAGHNTEDYPADEVQDMAQRIASEFAGSVLFQERNPLTGNRSVKTGASEQAAPPPSAPHAGPSSDTKAQHVASEVTSTLSLIKNLDKPGGES